MSAADKTKLDGIAEKANNYSHPSTHAATMISQDSTHRFVTDAEKSTWNGKANASHTHSNYASSSHTHNYAGSALLVEVLPAQTKQQSYLRQELLQ